MASIDKPDSVRMIRRVLKSESARLDVRIAELRMQKKEIEHQITQATGNTSTLGPMLSSLVSEIDRLIESQRSLINQIPWKE